ncbi:alpha/beta hydrolase [Viridibacillus sp. YIM B01967]|uniref:Alpha/beta hydrolase n=2 Tax=Viridibacillus soli TaxID=2798301 RepID=A0ABS1H8X2_9BACL|nr:alpha/beta hydrolase [Viridibacillus soli]
MDYSYDIKVSLPKSSPPIDGYPVIYILDGNSYFQFAQDVVRLQSKNEPKTLVNEAIVVGIGHQEKDKEASKRRFYDFTAPAEEYVYPDRLKGFDIGNHGGAQSFLDFIELELKPEIEGRYTINKEKQALFGHSLSGLFTLWTLFTKQNAFQTYLALSPSIWWNDHEILTYMEQFLNQLKEYEKRHLFVAVGECERFMVDDAIQVVNKLKEDQQAHVECEFYCAPEENHASVVPTVMSRVIRFASKY